MQFSRIISFVDLQVWNATNNGFSFVISFSSRSGPGFHGRPGFVASWRPIYQNRSAIRSAVRQSPKWCRTNQQAWHQALGALTEACHVPLDR